MRVRAIFLAAAFTAAAPAAAQVPPESGEAGAGAPQQPTDGAWPLYPHERHLLVRAEATTAARLSDPFAQGSLAPVTAFVEGTWAFLHLGRFLFGPSLGFQAGFDRTGGQYALQPGVAVYRRFSPGFAFTARVDVPILFTQGACDPQPPLMANGLTGHGISDNVNFIPAPGVGFCPGTSVGIEAAAGAAFYVRAGLAVTAELSFDYYLGDGRLGYPLLGGGLGLLFDYEVLP